jgi:hypothetical protein
VPADAESKPLRVILPLLQVFNARFLRVVVRQLLADFVIDAAAFLQVLRKDARQVLIGIRVERRIFPGSSG